MRTATLLMPLVLMLPLSGCGDDQDPSGAQELWDRIHTLGYQNFARAPGWEARRQSDAPHGDAVDIYVNPVVVEALSSGPGLTAWPVGSLIVKDGFDDGEPHLVAAMEKREGGWFWAEWGPSGDAKFSGSPELCTNCHDPGADGVRAFGFPQ